MSFHLVIVECESTATPILKSHGTQGEIIERLLRGDGADHRGHTELDLRISHWNAVHMETYPPLDGVDGLFLTGGGYAAYDDHPWSLLLIELIRDAYSRNIPMVGICFGYQLMARALGGRAAENPLGSELSPTNVTLTELGKHLIGHDSLRLHQMHLDAVVELPAGSEIIGSSEKCGAQLVYEKNKLLGIQGHPELDDVLAEHMLMIRLKEGLITQKTYDEALARVGEDHDGPRLTCFIKKFLADSRTACMKS